ncbi:MAG: isoprenylcysteine carboxylmethyltransferase family protein [Thermoplasmata archaeon]
MIAGTVLQLLAAALLASLAAAVAPGARGRRRDRRRSGGDATALRERAEEALWLVSIGTVVLTPFAVLIAPGPLAAPPWAFPFPGDSGVQLAGFAVGFAAAALLGASVRALGPYLTVAIALAPDQAVVERGPYRRVRHPIYTANVLLAVGIALAFRIPWIAIPLAAIVLLAMRRARREESLFLGSPRFAEEYHRYRERTGRFLPRRRPRPGEARPPGGPP